MKYNLYDFDGTIYDGDSGIDIIIYALKKHPKFIFTILVSVFLYVFKLINKKQFKSKMFSFVKYIDNIDIFVKDFWHKHEIKMKQFWVDKKSHKNDIIISASGYFWLKYIADKYKVFDLIATEYDVKTGELIGNNCHGEEKVRVFYKEYPNAIIDSMYTDSLNDVPLILKANKSFIIRKNKIKSYEDYKPSIKSKVLKYILSVFNNREIFCYLVAGFLTVVVNLVVKAILLSLFLNQNNSFELQIAVVISWIFAVIFAYYINRYYVFKSDSKGKIKEFFSFIFSRLLTLVVEGILSFILITLLKFNVAIMLLLIQVVIIILNYVFSKLFVFIKK